MKNCLNCKYEPKWQKLYDDLYDGFCEKSVRTVTYGAPTHGEVDEYCDIVSCSSWEKGDARAAIKARSRLTKLCYF